MVRLIPTIITAVIAATLFVVPANAAYVYDCTNETIQPDMCNAYIERMEALIVSTETLNANTVKLDEDLTWVVYSLGLITGMGITSYGLLLLKRAVFGKTVTESAM